ncbi:MAG: hypothetical protein ACRCSZ_02275 [Lactococcus lactis]
MSKLLIEESPLIVLPTLVKAIGINSAMILQQIHYFLNPEHNKNFHDGKYWVYKTLSDWQKKFDFLGRTTIRKCIKEMEDSNIIYSANLNKDKRDQTKWYSINYEEMEKIHKKITTDKREYVREINKCPVDKSVDNINSKQDNIHENCKNVSNACVNFRHISHDNLSQFHMSEVDTSSINKNYIYKITYKDYLEKNNAHVRPPSKCEIEQPEDLPSIDASVDQFSSELAGIKKIKKTKKKNTPKTSILDENGKTVSISDQFNRFWASYPRKVGRSACERVFARVVKQTPLLELLNAISEQRVERDKKISLGLWVSEQCHPRTWLNQGRWLDKVMTDEEMSLQAKQNMMSKISYKDMKNIKQGMESEASMRRTKFANDNNLSYDDLRKLEDEGFNFNSNSNSLNDLKNILESKNKSLPWEQ